MGKKDRESKKQDWLVYVHPDATEISLGEMRKVGEIRGKLIKDDINFLLEQHRERTIIIDDDTDSSIIDPHLPKPKDIGKLTLIGSWQKDCVTSQALSLVKGGYGDVLKPDRDCIIPGRYASHNRLLVSDICEQFPNSKHIFRTLGFDE